MFKDHFGCVLTTVLSIVMGFIMAIAVVIVDSLEFNFSVVFKIMAMITFVVLVTSIFVPYVKWGNKSAELIGLKPGSIGYKLAAGIIPSLILNTANTLIVSGANIFFNEVIPAEAQFSAWVHGIRKDWLICFIVSYFAAFVAEAVGKWAAKRSVPQNSGRDAVREMESLAV